jgi:hypothetical protein
MWKHTCLGVNTYVIVVKTNVIDVEAYMKTYVIDVNTYLIAMKT